MSATWRPCRIIGCDATADGPDDLCHDCRDYIDATRAGHAVDRFERGVIWFYVVAALLVGACAVANC